MIRNKIPTKTSYLAKCDFINKYNLNQIEKIPFLSKVVLELSSTDVFNALEKVNLNDYNSETKVKLFSILYLLRLFQPMIIYNSFVEAQETNNSFTLQVCFSTKKEIKNVLMILFTESWRPFFENSITYDKKCYNLKSSVETFSGTKKFLEKTIIKIDSNVLNINCKLIFENKKFRSRIVSAKMVKNIAPFWISC
jgi:hypothetical protein